MVKDIVIALSCPRIQCIKRVAWFEVAWCSYITRRNKADPIMYATKLDIDQSLGYIENDANARGSL